MHIDRPAQQGRRVKRFLNFLERLSLGVERPVARLVRDPRFNPLYHTGTITLFLLLVIGATGVYLTMFFQFGFAGSYRAVTNIEASLVGRVMRGLHRYASDLAVITALLHAWRTFFMDRFRGPRWLAWVTGIVLAVCAWIIGVTGYWLISDARSQLLNETLADTIGRARAGVTFLNTFLATDTRGAGWRFTLILLLVHVGLSAAVGLFFWLHVRRLSRAKWLPPRFGLALAGIPLLIAAIAVPLGMLPPLDPLRLPGPVDIDGFFLFYLPAALRWPPALLWGGAAVLLALACAIPWLLTRRRPAPVAVDAERCTGCSLCVADCPYRAITLVERPPSSSGRAYKYIAVVDPRLCVACGVCIGACEPIALALRDRPAEPRWEEALRLASAEGKPVKAVFTCERHAAQGQPPSPPPFYRNRGRSEDIVVIPLTCVGMAHPDLAARALAAGAAEVQFVGCPPEDCASREGNLWLQQRLARERRPMLDRRLAAAPIATDWLPPNDFARALRGGPHQSSATAYGFTPTAAHRRGILAALALAGLAVVVALALGRLPLQAHPAGQAVVEISMNHLSGLPVKGVTIAGATTGAPPGPAAHAPTRLVLEVDGEARLDKTYGDGNRAAQVFERVILAPGQHRVRLLMFDLPGSGRTPGAGRRSRWRWHPARSCRCTTATCAPAVIRPRAGGCTTRPRPAPMPAAASATRWTRA